MLSRRIKDRIPLGWRQQVRQLKRYFEDQQSGSFNQFAKKLPEMKIDSHFISIQQPLRQNAGLAPKLPISNWPDQWLIQSGYFPVKYFPFGIPWGIPVLKEDSKKAETW